MASMVSPSAEFIIEEMESSPGRQKIDFSIGPMPENDSDAREDSIS